MEKKVKIKINGTEYHVNEGENILSFCKSIGTDIPALCYSEALKPYGACRLCVVDVAIRNAKPKVEISQTKINSSPSHIHKYTGDVKHGITASCTLKASEGMEILTETEEIKNHRKMLFQFYLAQAPKSKTIQKLAAKYGVTDTPFTKKIRINDNLGNQCVLCGLCVRVCNDIIEKGVINYTGRGYYVKINTPYALPSDICMGCEACAEVCPTGAIRFEDVEDTRYGHSWSETKIPLKQCSVCGEYYSPQPFEDKTFEKMDPEIEEELREMCPVCRRKYHSKKQVAMKENRFSILKLK